MGNFAWNSACKQRKYPESRKNFQIHILITQVLS